MPTPKRLLRQDNDPRRPASRASRINQKRNPARRIDEQGKRHSRTGECLRYIRKTSSMIRGARQADWHRHDSKVMPGRDLTGAAGQQSVSVVAREGGVLRRAAGVTNPRMNQPMSRSVPQRDAAAVKPGPSASTATFPGQSLGARAFKYDRTHRGR